MTDTSTQLPHVQGYATAFQVAPDQVNRVRLELSALKQTGTLVDVTVGGVSKLFKRVTWDELGIPATDRRAERLRRGTKALFPESYYRPLQSLDAQIRANLTRYSFTVSGFFPWSYVPVTAYFTWLDRHMALVEQFNARRQNLVNDYPVLVDALRADWEKIAEEAFDAYSSRAALANVRAVWRDHIVGKALAQMPTVDELTDPESGLRVHYKTAMIENQASIVQSEIEISDKIIESQNLRADIDRVHQMKTIERGLIEEQFKTMVSPFAEVMNQLEAQIYADVQDVLAIIKEHGSLPGRTADKARGVMELYKLMAVQSRPDLEAALGQLEGALAVSPVRQTGKKQQVYNAATIAAALSDIATMTHDGAKAAVAQGVSRADMIDL